MSRWYFSSLMASEKMYIIKYIFFGMQIKKESAIGFWRLASEFFLNFYLFPIENDNRGPWGMGKQMYYYRLLQKGWS